MRFHEHNIRILRVMTAGLLSITLASCMPKEALINTAPPQLLTPAPVVKVQQVDIAKLCATVKAYKPDEEKALADAVSALAPTNPIITAMGDYGRMRADGRACIARAKNP